MVWFQLSFSELSRKHHLDDNKTFQKTMLEPWERAHFSGFYLLYHFINLFGMNGIISWSSSFTEVYWKNLTTPLAVLIDAYSIFLEMLKFSNGYDVYYVSARLQKLLFNFFVNYFLKIWKFTSKTHGECAQNPG